MQHAVVLQFFDPHVMKTMLPRCIELAATALGRNTKVEGWRHEGTLMALLQVWSPDITGAEDRAPVPLFGEKPRAFAYTGYIGTPSPRSEGPLRLIRFRDGQLQLTDSPGGVAAFFLADADRQKAFVWSSHAGVEALFHTTTDQCIAISNRPLLSHLLARGADTPVMNEAWGRRVLLRGYTLGDDTQFAGTFLAKPRSCLVLSRRGLSQQPHPLPLQDRFYPPRSPEAVADYVAATLEATSVLRRMPRAEFRLSGGKDSRYLAALLRHTGIDTDNVTYVPEGQAEGTYAAHVAELLDLPHRIQPRPVATGAALDPAVKANLRTSDAALCESWHLSYLDPTAAGVPIIEGHAHHARGGFNMPMSRKRVDIVKLLVDGETRDAPFLASDALIDERRERVLTLLDEMNPNHPTSLGYWFYNDHRMSRGFHGSYLNTATRHPFVCPLMDERVLRVCANLAPIDRVTEYTFFAALKHLAPGMDHVPLYEDAYSDAQWRFDRGGAKRSPHRAGYDDRYTPLPGTEHTHGRDGFIEESYALAAQMLEATASSPAAQRLTELVDPAFLAAFREGEEAIAARGVHVRQAILFAWRLSAISLILDRAWI